MTVNRQMVFGDAPVASSTISTTPQSSVTSYEFTWTFDTTYEVGQYITGDYFVIDPGSGVNITGITPQSVDNGTGRIINGSVINPQLNVDDFYGFGGGHGWDSGLAQGGQPDTQGYQAYVSALNVGFGISGGSPLNLTAGQTLVSCESIEPTVSATAAILSTPPSLVAAAPLTVVSAAPLVGAFRPGYYGTTKTTYLESDINRSLLQNLTPVGTPPTFEFVSSVIGRMSLEHIPYSLSRYIHPLNNMPDYGREYATIFGIGSLLLNCNYTASQKEELLRDLVQIGIDLDGAYSQGMFWIPAGGQHQGRKWPIVMKRGLFGETLPIENDPRDFGDDGQTFFVSETSPGVYNYGYGGYTADHVGMPEFSFRYWDASPVGSDADFDWSTDPYRTCCTAHSWWGQCLAAMMMGLRVGWGWEPIFQYLDRYRQIQDGEGYFLSVSEWTIDMWDAYRGDYSPAVVTNPPEWIPPDAP